MAFEVIWQYRVHAEFEEQFCETYGSSGAWAQLFAKHAGYGGTRLLFDASQSLYVTIDSWNSESAFNDFFVVHRTDYDEADARFAHFVQNTSRIGVFESVE